MNEQQLTMLNGDDPFLAHGQATISVQGQYLSFNKGEWLAGQETTLVPLGTRFAVNMPSYRRGWKRWNDRKVTREKMVLLVSRTPAHSREALGDLDRRLWEVDPVTRNERDPWAETEEVQMTSSEGELYIYGASSKGGLNCLRRLCVDYGKARRMHEGQVPVVELGRDSYEHKVYGRTYVPVLTIVDWVGEEMLALGDGRGAAEVVEEDDIPFEKPGLLPASMAGLPPSKLSRVEIHTDTLAENASGPAKNDKVNVAKSGYDQVQNERQAKAEELRVEGIRRKAKADADAALAAVADKLAKREADAALAAVADGTGSEAAAVAAVEGAKVKRATRF